MISSIDIRALLRQFVTLTEEMGSELIKQRDQQLANTLIFTYHSGAAAKSLS